MDPIFQALITAVISFLTASTGFWAYIKKRKESDDQTRDALVSLLMGLAQNKILFLGMKYIERGWVTKDEYQDLRRYLYDPYMALQGNGTAERIMHAVERLPFQAAESIMETAFQKIPIRETDPTGLPSEKHYEGEDRRGKRKD